MLIFTFNNFRKCWQKTFILKAHDLRKVVLLIEISVKDKLGSHFPFFTKKKTFRVQMVLPHISYKLCLEINDTIHSANLQKFFFGDENFYM